MMGRTFHCEIDLDTAAMPAFRADLRGWLAQVHPARTEREDILLACWEAVANAIRHPVEPTGRVSFRARSDGGELTVTVCDTGSWREREGQRGAAKHPLGLELMGALMDDVRIVRGADGTRVILQRRASGHESSAHVQRRSGGLVNALR